MADSINDNTIAGELMGIAPTGNYTVCSIKMHGRDRTANGDWFDTEDQVDVIITGKLQEGLDKLQAGWPVYVRVAIKQSKGGGVGLKALCKPRSLFLTPKKTAGTPVGAAVADDADDGYGDPPF